MSSSRELDPSDVLRALASVLAPYLREPLGLSGNMSDDWVDVAEQLPTCKRALYKACRTSELAARRVKRRWLARRADLDAWIETHETGAKPEPSLTIASNRKLVESVLTPAQQLERETEAVLKELGLRRATDAERAAKGLPPYDVDREYAEHLERQKEREQQKAAKERDDNDPRITSARAAAVRAADEAKRAKPGKQPRVQCKRCRRELVQRKDGSPTRHDCPHGYGYGCYNASGNSEEDGTSRCPWCAKERETTEPRKIDPT